MLLSVTSQLHLHDVPWRHSNQKVNISSSSYYTAGAPVPLKSRPNGETRRAAKGKNTYESPFQGKWLAVAADFVHLPRTN